MTSSRASHTSNTRNSYKDEDPSKRKINAHTSTNRTSSYYNRESSRDGSRDNRNNRDIKDSKEARNGSKHDYKINDRNRSKDYKTDYKRENESRDSKRIQSEEDRYKCRYSSSSSSYHRYSSRDSSRRYHRSSEDHHRHRSDDRNRYRKRNSRSPRSHLKDQLPVEQSRSSAQEMEQKPKTDGIHSEKTNIEIQSDNTSSMISPPLNDPIPKVPNVIVTPSTATVSATNNSNQTSGIQLPSYYNPSVINPSKYAEQMQKRKLLWGAKKTEVSAGKWGNAQFSEDSDGKVASKFMRLMGIKSGSSETSDMTPAEADSEKKMTATPDVKSREAMFSSMEQQYEVARQATHTMRGVGLGFSSQSRPF